MDAPAGASIVRGVKAQHQRLGDVDTAVRLVVIGHGVRVRYSPASIPMGRLNANFKKKIFFSK